ncbi:MAG: hypothetical protein V8Q42_11070 [Anaerovoracaceae bacterium]
MYYTTTYDSPLGEIMIAADSKGIAGLWIQGQKYFETWARPELLQQPSSFLALSWTRIMR